MKSLQICLLLLSASSCCPTQAHTQPSAQRPFFIAIAGASGAGKSTMAQNILKVFNGDAVILSQDRYYRDQSHLPAQERDRLNFDHPDTIDFALFKSHLEALGRGESIQVPTYDFKTHSQTDKYTTVSPKQVIIVEGILLLAMPELRPLFDMKIFVDTDPDICILRRAKRDQEERGRSFESVYQQYLATVRPMYLQFVEPSKRYADVIIPWSNYNDIAVNLIVSQLNQLATDRS